jgi:hypothetical protein
MKLVHILKSEPDATTKLLMDATGEGHDVEVFKMYGDSVDYKKLVELIMGADRNISWW